MLFDTHCHLDYFTKEEMSALLKACLDSNVRYLQNISVDLESFESIIQPCLENENIFASIGIHPCNVGESATSPDTLHIHHEKYSHYVKSVGETGLDYYHENSADIIKQQKDSLVNHIDFACQVNKPLVFHVRDAEEDFIDIITSLMKEVEFRGIMHCFTGSKRLLYKMLDLNFYISLAGIVTFKNANELQNLAKEIPINRLLIETDSPYLAPAPMRGGRNEPALIKHTATFLAKHLNIPFEEICNTTTQNAGKILNIPIEDKMPSW